MYYRAASTVFLLTMLSMTSLFAQQDRIAGPVDRLRTVALKGNIHPNANPQFDAGPVDPIDETGPCHGHAEAIRRAAGSTWTSCSRNSRIGPRVTITPGLLRNNLGTALALSPNDIGQVVSWLQSEGLAVDEVSRARNWIWFSGTAAQMQAALRTQIRRYRVDGESHFANADEPSVPAAIEPLVTRHPGIG